METLKFAGFFAFGALCVAAGVFVLQAEGLAAGVGAIAFGALCILGAFATRPATAPEEPVRTGTVQGRGRAFTGLVLTFSRRRAALGLAMGVLFTITGVALLLDGEVLVGALCAVFFGLMSVLGVLNLTQGTARLVFTTDELAHVAALGHGAVRWDDVIGLTRYDIRGTQMLRLHSDGRVDMTGGAVAVLARVTGRHDFEIGLDAVGVDPDWLYEVIERCVNERGARDEVARGDVALPAG